MTIKIGTIIKKLRAENNTTQDALATTLGITPQAISRWEAEAAYPDMELLPAIADFFNVSIDELLGYKLSEREERLQATTQELYGIDEEGSLEEKISFARAACIQFPSEHKFKAFLASYLFTKWREEGKPSALGQEAELLCQAVMEHSKDARAVSFAIRTLNNYYAELGETGKALEVVNRLQPMSYCRENVLADGIGDGKVDLYLQDAITKHIDHACDEISWLVLDDELSDSPETWDKKIEMMNIAVNICKTAYGNNLMEKHARVGRYYELICEYLLRQGKINEALDALEKLQYHALEYDKSDEADRGKHYTSPLADKVIFPKERKALHNYAYYLREELENERYDCLRNTDRFKSVYAACDASAK